jgi:hypothetical protein
MNIPGVTGSDRYHIVKENPAYPLNVTIRHFLSLNDWENSLKSQDRIAINSEMNSWVKRRVVDWIWSTSFQLLKSFRSEPARDDSKNDTKIENGPVMHLEAFHFRKEDEEKYSGWLNDYGFNAFIPLFIGLGGLKGYDCYRNTGRKGISELREWDYPLFLSILYFENMASLENYEKSRELISYQKALRNVFPNGLSYKWYVQYTLMQSWRK